MSKASDKMGEEQTAKPADADHFAEMLKGMAAVPLHPLMAHPTAALAAATAIGFGLATHMTSVFLGSLHGAIEATGKLARRIEEEQAKAEGRAEKTPDEAEAARPDAVAANVKPRKAAQPKPATARSAASEPAAFKPTAEKLATVKPTMARRAAAATRPDKAATAKVARTAKANGKADDLKRIEGIGPKLEQLLNGRGIRRFVDIAALDPAGLEALDTAIGLDGRAMRDDWAGQARKLAGGRK